MKWKYELQRIGGDPARFSEFIERNGLELEVRERPARMKTLPRYYAHLKRVEIKEGGMLKSSSGDGDTPEEAIADYARQLRGELIVWGAYSNDRREIQCPNEWLPEAD